ncbi:MAG: hypothetical protein U0Q16_23105 [Bryobacteraceae bacterium]
MFLPRMCGRLTSRVSWVPALVWLAFVFQASARVLPAQAWRALGPFGGPADAVSSHPRIAGFLVAGSRQAVLFHSADGGERWQRIPFPAQQNATLHAIWIDPAERGHWLVGVSPERGSAGLYSTTDSGTTWHAVEAFAGRAVWSLAAAPGDSKLVAAGASDGVWLSRDNGSRWQRSSPADNAELQPVVALAIHPGDARTVLAGTTHLPWRTADGGASWQSVHDGMLDDSDVFSIAIDRTGSNRVWASACSGMYRSADGGRTWTKLMGSAEASFRTYVIAQDPGEANRVFAGTSDGLLRSTDGGTTWRKLRPGLVKAIAFDGGRAGRLYAATGAGLIRSDDSGDTFQTIQNGYGARQLVQWLPAGSRLTVWDALDRGAAWASGDGGETWQRGAASSNAAAAAPRVVTVRRRMANGKTRMIRKQVAAPAPAPAGARIGLAVHASVARGDASRVAIAGESFLAASHDGGKTFESVPSPGAATTAVLARANELWVATSRGVFKRGWKAPATWIPVTLEALAGESVRILDESGNAIVAASQRRGAVSIDGGVTWKTLSPVAPSAEFYDFAATGRYLLAATSHGLFRSQDSGRSWLRASEPGPDTVHQVFVHPARPDVAFLAQFDSVWTSTDGGQTWRRMARPGLTGAAIHSLAVAGDRPERLYALTSAHGVFVTEWEK